MTTADLATSLVSAIDDDDIDRLRDELSRADPDAPADLAVLHDVVAAVLGDITVDADVRETLAEAWLRSLAVSSVLPQLEARGLFAAGVRGLEDTDWLVRAYAAETFTYIGDATHVPRLVETVLDPNEHPTVRVDAMEAAFANALDVEELVDQLLTSLRDEPSEFVRVMVDLHGLLHGRSPGPAIAQLQELQQAEQDRWPPQESSARILRTVAWLIGPEVGCEYVDRVRRVVDCVLENGVLPIYADLVPPAIDALARAARDCREETRGLGRIEE